MVKKYNFNLQVIHHCLTPMETPTFLSLLCHCSKMWQSCCLWKPVMWKKLLRTAATQKRLSNCFDFVAGKIPSSPLQFSVNCCGRWAITEYFILLNHPNLLITERVPDRAKCRNLLLKLCIHFQRLLKRSSSRKNQGFTWSWPSLYLLWFSLSWLLEVNPFSKSICRTLVC